MKLKYKEYQAQIRVDEERDTFFGRVLDLNDKIAFEGSSLAELREAFADAIEDYIDWCKESGEEPERPYSGRVLVRMEPDLHRSLARRASGCGESLNGFIVSTLATAVSRSAPKREMVKADGLNMMSSTRQSKHIEKVFSTELRSVRGSLAYVDGDESSLSPNAEAFN